FPSNFQILLVVFYLYLPETKPFQTMKAYDSNHPNTLNVLISEYEAMSQKGTVVFFEETAFQRIISHYRQDNRPDQAIHAVDLALSQHPSFADFYLLKAQILLEKGCQQLALDCLRQAELYAPNQLEVLLLRAEIMTSLGQTEDAFSLLERLKLIASTKAEQSEVFFCEACIFEYLEEFDQMFFALREALYLSPNNKSVLKRLWYSVELSKLYHESVALHQFLLDNDPYCHICWYNLGHAYFCLGHFEQAAESFEYAYLIDPSFSSAYKDCAESFIALGDYEKALSCYEDALEQIEADSNIYTSLGFCYEQINDMGMAHAFYLKAIAVNPGDDAAYYRLGQNLARQRQWIKAIEYFSKAIECNPFFEEYMAALAEAYHQIEDNLKAAHWFKQTTETAPEQSKYWIQYANFLIENGRDEEALLTLEDASAFAGGVELLYCRAACLLLMNRRQEGLELFNEALQQAYDLHEVFFDFAPELEDDREVHTVLYIYR
ncbi:MAG: tetratricopeptide repeat protein, partial [Bacteroidota bacterium]